MKVIALTGTAGAGKDTVARFLAEELTARGIKHQRMAFADALKDMAAYIYGLDRDKLNSVIYKAQPLPQYPLVPENPTWKQRVVRWFKEKVLKQEVPTYLTPRIILQKLGTEVCRSIHPDTWTKIIERRIYEAMQNGIDVVIITDMRFMNEYRMLKRVCGNDLIAVHVIRTDGKPLAPTHRSEIEVEKVGAHCNYKFICESGELDCLKHLTKTYLVADILYDLTRKSVAQ